MRDQWTAERVNLLQELWAGGASAGAIAAQLGGLSRSAVLGKIYRLRWRATKRRAAPPKRPRRRKADEPLQPALHLSGKCLLALTNDSCRWIVEAGVKWLVTATLSHFQ